MTTLAIVIPFKAKDQKSRLAAVLTKGERRELSGLMLVDVLDAILSAGRIGQTFVVSSSVEALTLAEESGAFGVRESRDGGVNSAIKKGIEAVQAENMMVIPSDVPLLKGSEIRGAMALKEGGSDAVLAPSFGFDGTNLLAFSRSKQVPLSFDRDSFWNHLRGAGMKRLSVAVCSGRGIRFDVDTPAQLRQLARAGPGSRSGSFARRALR